MTCLWAYVLRDILLGWSGSGECGLASVQLGVFN